MKLVTTTALFTLLVGCSSPAALQQGGAIYVDISDDPTYDYKVILHDIRAANWNVNNSDDRAKAVREVMARQCGDLTFTETVIKTPVPTWSIKVKCRA